VKHPFTDEDIKAGKMVINWTTEGSSKVMNDMLNAIWDSAVKRGAVLEDVGVGGIPWCVSIKLPEDKQMP
jgi:hypothetical protein